MRDQSIGSGLSKRTNSLPSCSLLPKIQPLLDTLKAIAASRNKNMSQVSDVPHRNVCKHVPSCPPPFLLHSYLLSYFSCSCVLHVQAAAPWISQADTATMKNPQHAVTDTHMDA